MRTPVHCPVCKKRQGMDIEAPSRVWFRCRHCKRQFDDLMIPLPKPREPARQDDADRRHDPVHQH